MSRNGIGVVESNRLASQRSPYLLQHGKNPVDWYPWGKEAFEKARSQGKLIFLSIGYSTCHWCHVMARECFEDPEIARELNKSYVSIKVDREEQPDVDHIYMRVCQMLTGSGGWPLTVITTPDKRPFFAGTYFPKTGKFGLPGLLNILQVISEAWEKDKEPLLLQADKIFRGLSGDEDVPPGPQIPGDWHSKEVLENAFSRYSVSFDEDWGGFDAAPKFLTPHNLLFMLRFWRRTGRKKALHIVEKTVVEAYSGGVYDHLGFGFFRYATDSRWRTPHFEKMLYDNGFSLQLLCQLYRVTKEELYKDMAFEVVSFLADEMRSPDGAFYSAIDAESQGKEGEFYLWKPGEITAVLGKGQGEAFCERYGITSLGKSDGKSVPYLPKPRTRKGVSSWQATELTTEHIPRDSLFEGLRQKMLLERNKRARPFKDDKILTSWNAIAISALAQASCAFGSEFCLELSEKAASFILNHLAKDGEVYRRYRDGHVDYPGYLDDYAYLARALLDLYQATYKTGYLETGCSLTRQTVNKFWDPVSPGFFLTGSGRDDLILRPKETSDGAIPSGNSVAIMNLLRVSHLGAGYDDYEIKARSAMEEMIPALKKNPMSYGYLLCALQYAEEAQDITVWGKKEDKGAQTLLKYIRNLYLPETQIIFSPDQAALAGETPADLPERPQVTICRNKVCGPPIADIQDLQKALMKIPAPIAPD